MRPWPWWLVEVWGFLLFGGLVTAMALDVRKRWQQYRQDNAPAEPDDEPEASGVRRRDDDEHDDDEPPPVAA